MMKKYRLRFVSRSASPNVAAFGFGDYAATASEDFGELIEASSVRKAQATARAVAGRRLRFSGVGLNAYLVEEGGER